MYAKIKIMDGTFNQLFQELQETKSASVQVAYAKDKDGQQIPWKFLMTQYGRKLIVTREDNSYIRYRAESGTPTVVFPTATVGVSTMAEELLRIL